MLNQLNIITPLLWRVKLVIEGLLRSEDMKKVSMILIVVFLLILTGCQVEVQPINSIGNFENMTVVDKKTISGFRYASYEITFEKNGEKVVLKTSSDEQHDALVKGVTVNVEYEKDTFYITNIEFPNLEGTRSEK